MTAASEIFTQWDAITTAASEKVTALEAAMAAALTHIDRQQAAVDAERQRLESELHKRQETLATTQRSYQRAVANGMDTEAAAAALTKADTAVRAVEAQLAALDAAADFSCPDALRNKVEQAEGDLNGIRERFNQSRHDFEEELQEQERHIRQFIDERLRYADVRPVDPGIRQRYDRLVLHKQPEAEKPSGVGFTASRRQVATPEEIERIYHRR